MRKPDSDSDEAVFVPFLPRNRKRRSVVLGTQEFRGNETSVGAQNFRAEPFDTKRCRFHNKSAPPGLAGPQIQKQQRDSHSLSYLFLLQMATVASWLAFNVPTLSHIAKNLRNQMICDRFFHIFIKFITGYVLRKPVRRFHPHWHLQSRVLINSLTNCTYVSLPHLNTHAVSLRSPLHALVVFTYM